LITVRWLDQILSSETSWSVFWDTRSSSDPARQNVALAGSEAEAMERTAHFLKLGFFVLCVKAPSGAVLMDKRDIADRFKHILPRPPSASEVERYR
jgi:hypothetical protein